MSVSYQSYSPVESRTRPKSYHSATPRFYAPPTISTPGQSDSLQPTAPSYRHSHSYSTVSAGPQYGQTPANMRERSSSHSLYPAPYYPGGSSAPLPPSLNGAYPGAPNAPPQTRSRSGSYSPHPMQLQPGSRPSSRPHSPSLSFTGDDELHFGSESPPSASRQPSAPSSSHGAFPPAPYSAAQQLSPQPQGAENGLPASRERSTSASYPGGYAPYVPPTPPQQYPPQDGPMYPQHSPAPSFNGGYPNGPPSILQPGPPPINTSFHAPPPPHYPPPPPAGNPANPNANASYYSIPPALQVPNGPYPPQAQAQAPGPSTAEDSEKGLGTTILGAGAGGFVANKLGGGKMATAGGAVAGSALLGIGKHIYDKRKEKKERKAREKAEAQALAQQDQIASQNAQAVKDAQAQQRIEKNKNDISANVAVLEAQNVAEDDNSSSSSGSGSGSDSGSDDDDDDDD